MTVPCIVDPKIDYKTGAWASIFVFTSCLYPYNPESPSFHERGDLPIKQQQPCSSVARLMLFHVFRLTFLVALTIYIVSADLDATDFVIIGAGTSGCVLAARLCAALPKAKITLLERGQERSKEDEFLVRSPRLTLNVLKSTSVSEQWLSLPNDGLLGNRSLIVSGKTLGGSSAINGMQWSIPLKGTVRGWNISGLSERVARKYFRRAYRKVGFSQQPVSLRQVYADDIVNASMQSGFSQEFDPLNQTERYSVWHQSIAVSSSGRRTDSCTAYLLPVLKHQCKNNLHLLQGVTVSKLILNEESPKRVIGVEYVSSNDTSLTSKLSLQARKEVFLTAGPYGSPKILQLSGIGPQRHLRKVGIEPIVNLEVGMKTQARVANFATSIYVGVPLEPSNNSTVLRSKKTYTRWQNGKSSVLGSHPAAAISILARNGYSFTATASAEKRIDIPLVSSVCVNNPSSFGYLLVKDSNPFSTPDISLNLLGSDDEYRRQKICVKTMINVHQNFPSKFALSLISPANDVSEEFLRGTGFHSYHFVGGCAVGNVLHGNLKVRRVEGVRVIDASAFKTMPVSSGPLASTYMLAEYSADIIKANYSDEFS